MSPAAFVEKWLTQAGREPATLRSPAYLSTTAPHLHMINLQNFWYKKMFFGNMANIYMKFRYIQGGSDIFGTLSMLHHGNKK